MPGFGNPFTGLKLDRKIDTDELIRSLRFMVAAEYEAVEMYSKVAEATDNDRIKKAIMNIVNEEVVHAGEFLKLLSEIEPSEFNLYQEGFKEVEDLNKEAVSRVYAKILPHKKDKPAPIFPKESPKILDNKDHFPIPDLIHARQALARVNQYSSAPPWYKGSLKDLKVTVVKAVKAKFPSIKIEEKKFKNA